MLTKLYPYIPDSSSDDGTTIEPDIPFSPYELSFGESFGLDPFSIEVYGIGDGSFHISYFDAGLDGFVPSTVSGTILAGEEESFTFGSAIPEPSTWAMMLLGFSGLGFVGYRQSWRTKPQTA